MDTDSSAGSQGWEVVSGELFASLADPDSTVDRAPAPLSRPAIVVQPRILPKNILVHGKPIAMPESSPRAMSVPHSGDALQRPDGPASNSSGPSRGLTDLGFGLPRPLHDVPAAPSLLLPRDLELVPEVTQHAVVSGSSQQLSRVAPRPLKRPRTTPVGHSTAISRVRATSESTAILAMIPRFLICFASFSDLLQRLQHSSHGHDHLLRILDGFAPTTVLRYITCLLSLFEICRRLQVNLAHLDDIGLADLLMTGASEAGKFSSMTLKAIRWSWHQFQLSCFKDCFSPVVSSFCKTKFVTDRRESLPLPLVVLIQWERRILQSAATEAEVLILGTFLVLAFSGMRFGDIQRVIMHRLQYDGKTLRGLSWKTKTCHSGVPFGILCSGFLSKGSHHWVHKFLMVLDSALAGETPAHIDFLLPSCRQGVLLRPLEAMPYSEALFFLRRFMTLPWRSNPLEFSNTVHYTVHGLKSTFLSWASQLRLDPESRRLQGRHKDPLQSTRLYSRDDINGSLFVQQSIVSRVLEGRRPHTPLARGGQLPLQEPPFTLEFFKKDTTTFEWKFFGFDKPPEIIIMPDLDEASEQQPATDDSSSDSSSDSSESSAVASSAEHALKPTKTSDMQFDEVDMGSYRNTVHVIMDWGEMDSPDHLRRIRTACGRMFPSCNITPHSEWTLHSGKTFCTHPGCRKGWFAVGALQ